MFCILLGQSGLLNLALSYANVLGIQLQQCRLKKQQHQLEIHTMQLQSRSGFNSSPLLLGPDFLIDMVTNSRAMWTWLMWLQIQGKCRLLIAHFPPKWGNGSMCCAGKVNEALSIIRSRHNTKVKTLDTAVQAYFKTHDTPDAPHLTVAPA